MFSQELVVKWVSSSSQDESQGVGDGKNHIWLRNRERLHEGDGIRPVL